jgi:hypothetical protein
LVFASALFASTGAVAQVRRDVKTLVCDSPTFQSLMNAPVKDVREDLAVTLNALTQFEFITPRRAQEGCLGRAEARYSPVPLLLGYIENRWISESLGEPIEPVATVLDALRQEMRRQESISTPQSDPEFEARRQLSFQRSFAVEIGDQALSADEFKVGLRNISSWTLRLYPSRTQSGARAPQLWFEPIPDGAPVKFECLDRSYSVATITTGQRVSLDCRYFAELGGNPTHSPLTADSKGRWTLHRGEKIGWLTSASEMDVSVGSLQAYDRANALVAQSTCSSRGSCADEKEIRNRGQSNLPGGIVLAVVFALVLGFILPRFAAYFLGPAFLVLAGALLVVGHSLFVPSHTDGSPAGLIVPGIAWLALIVCCGLGLTLIATGIARIKRARSQSQT